MAGRRLTMERFEEIRRLLALGRKTREIARTLKVSRNTVRGVQSGEFISAGVLRVISDPLWMSEVSWIEVVGDLSLGHPLKFIWEERAASLTTYPNFWKQFYRKFPNLREATVTAREFDPGECAEVDYAGDKIEWVDIKTGEIHEAVVFVAALGFSQLFFAWASENMQSRNWLIAHRRMLQSFGGVPRVLVPDCLKQGVLKCHIYDPDLNPSYSELAAHYGAAIVPARPGRPKDKAIVEGAVKILMRLVRWRYRGHTFTSISEINRALERCVSEINKKPHTRFKVSRLERFEKMERAALKRLPEHAFETAEWKKATLHADCFIALDSAYYSAPHIHRGRELRVKITENQVEIFFNLERIALHPRDKHRCGNRVKNPAHFPESSKAYYEATPQNLLRQARFLHADLHSLAVELFNLDVYGNIRRVQGLLRIAIKEINAAGVERGAAGIEKSVAQMRRFNQFRVSYFEECLKNERRKNVPGEEAEIARSPHNPMLRYGVSSQTGEKQ
jgi:transposase